VLYALFYETAEDVSNEQLMDSFPAHKARWQACQDAGTLVAIGPFADRSGALSVWTSQEAAEEFAAGDPFVTGGLMKNWYIRPWLEAILAP
jgi:uncharacterized protein